MLCAAPFVDELLAGVPTLGSTGIRADFGLDYAAVAAVVLSVPLLFGLCVETPLLLLAKRFGRRRLATAAFAAMAAGALAAACSAAAWQLALGLSFAAASAGLALALVETALMDAVPRERERWMTRWTIGAVLGDLAAPGLFALVAWVGFGWRGAFVAAACLAAIAARLVTRRMPDADRGDELERHAPIRAALRRALASRRLLAWSVGVAVCDLLDEILVVVAIVLLREAHGANAAAAALTLAVLPAAGALGLVVTEWMLRRVAPLTWLALNCVPCALAILGLASFSRPGAAVAMLAVIGFTAAPMWPIATAQAYRTLPEDSTAVAAVGNLFSPLGVAMPVAIAAAADRWGLAVAVVLLAAQPLTLLVLATARSGRAP